MQERSSSASGDHARGLTGRQGNGDKGRQGTMIAEVPESGKQTLYAWLGEGMGLQIVGSDAPLERLDDGRWTFQIVNVHTC